MTWVMKILCKITGKSGYPYDTGEHIYSHFKLTMPILDEYDKNDLKCAHDKVANLTKSQLKQLKRLVRFISIFRFAYFPINYKILPVFYDLGLFTGSARLWRDAYKWILLKDRRKYNDLDLDLTLVLLTALLAGSDDGLGADRWYRMGITRKALKHLIGLIEKRSKNVAENNTSSLDGNTLSGPMGYDLHSKVTADERIAGLRYGRKLKKKVAEAMKKAGEEYESSERQ